MIITLLRKPLEGSVADNALKHGCGSINIDATRIGNIVQDTSKNGRSSDKHKSTVFQSGLKEEFEGNITTGRWPANFILIHKEGCELKGTKKVKGHKGYPNGPGGIWSKDYQDTHQKDRGLTDVKTVKDNEAWVGHADKDGKEEVANWACVNDCPVQELDRQSGITKSTGGRIGNAQGIYSNQGRTGWGTEHERGDPGIGDKGGASRYFKQFKKEGN